MEHHTIVMQLQRPAIHGVVRAGSFPVDGTLPCLMLRGFSIYGRHSIEISNYVYISIYAIYLYIYIYYIYSVIY